MASAIKRKTEKDELIMKYAPLVKIIALRLAMRLPSHIELDDLINVGIAGLLESIGRFDSKKGVKIETFLSFRIKGAMLDELRRMDWMPRSLRQKAKTLEWKLSECESKLGRRPTDVDMSEFLGIEIEEYHKLLNDANSVAVFSLEDMGFSESGSERNILECIADPQGVDPVETLNLKQRKAALGSAIDKLAEKERTVLTLYYYEDMNLKEIGAVIGVTESRVCQLHSQAIHKLKGKVASLAM
ncbi:MAG: FliA/WhiG family RNA polymerase sigma factor [Thermodesulfobacteriota bacterium]